MQKHRGSFDLEALRARRRIPHSCRIAADDKAKSPAPISSSSSPSGAI
jgi:hypothetical protein